MFPQSLTSKNMNKRVNGYFLNARCLPSEMSSISDPHKNVFFNNLHDRNNNINNNSQPFYLCVSGQ